MKNFLMTFLSAVIILATVSSGAHADEKKVGPGLDPEVISEYVNRAMPTYSTCYQNEIKEGKAAPTGNMNVKFVINGEGKVTKASVANSTLNNPAIENCVVNTVKAVQFPEPVGHGAVDVTHPFSFGTKAASEKAAKKAKKK